MCSSNVGGRSTIEGKNVVRIADRSQSSSPGTTRSIVTLAGIVAAESGRYTARELIVVQFELDQIGQQSQLRWNQACQ